MLCTAQRFGLVDLVFCHYAELQKLRQQVVAEIRSNQQLEHDLDQMDIKIGLLIKNRITLQVSHSVTGKGGGNGMKTEMTLDEYGPVFLWHAVFSLSYYSFLLELN